MLIPNPNLTQHDRIVLVQFWLPIILFLLIGRIYNFNYIGLQYAFTASGLVALNLTVVLITKKIILNRIALANNLFFLGGLMAFVTRWPYLIDLYTYYPHIICYICIILTGTISTFFSKHELIGTASLDTGVLKAHSFKVLLLALLCFITVTLIPSDIWLKFDTRCKLTGSIQNIEIKLQFFIAALLLMILLIFNEYLALLLKNQHTINAEQ